MTPSPDAASVKPACLYCGSEIKAVCQNAPENPFPPSFRLSCDTSGCPGNPCWRWTSAEYALAAASRPAHPVRELTDVQMEGCVHVGLNEISAEQFSMSWVRGSKGEKNINEIRAAIRAAVARALAIVRGET